MKKTQLKGVLILLLTAFIWGSSFAAQSIGMENVPAFTFNGIRTLMGAAVLLPYILIRDAVQNKKLSPDQIRQKKLENKKILLPGAILGVILCVAGNLQQAAFPYTSSGKIAFITAFYMIFVPVFGLVIGKRVQWPTWICVLLGIAGLYCLCIGPNGFTGVNKGDLLSFFCSMGFAVHILAIEKFIGRGDAIRMSCVQFLVSGTITVILMFIFERPDPSAIRAAILPLLYSGVLSCGLAYTFQIVGQKYTESTVASLLMCMESVFGVLTGAVVLHERLTGVEIIGCVVMFAAMILSQFSGQIVSGLRRRGSACTG